MENRLCRTAMGLFAAVLASLLKTVAVSWPSP
jgi:hypothetical protein